MIDDPINWIDPTGLTPGTEGSPSRYIGEFIEACYDALDKMFNKQDKKLTQGEIDKLIDGGVHPHDLKDNARQDLFKDSDGNIIVKPKSGTGPGDPTGLNINDF